MINVKASGAAAGAAFILSLLLGLISGSLFWVVILRALAFAALFFLLASGAWFLITRFLPELAGGGAEARLAPGSKVNIALDDADPFAAGDAPPVMPGGDGAGELGDISDLGGAEAGAFALPEEPGVLSAGMDQNGQEGYTKEGLEEENPFGELLPPPAMSASPAPAGGAAAPDGEAPPNAGLSAGDEFMPDLDGMASSFNSGGAVLEELDEKPAVRRPSVGGKPSKKVEGDFNPKDMAAAIKDRLKRE